ncbi:alkaline phosphatase family protein [Cohnella candidum]|uniref:Acid phosphatase n=1 Tax=Cohnella candidum TaxID=2674991 RepID=A0A3G3JVF1_9BACL|nr:alkaline phosphatase family protein [Cohnella candidum]AYQ72220.1 acid phosphatase [Cohnella candidum]
MNSAKRLSITLFLAALLLPACAAQNGQASAPSLHSPAVPVHTAATNKPKVNKIVVVIEENHSYKQIFNNPNAPYMNQLMKAGANLTNHYAIEHPSQPNYYDLFSGSNQGIKDDKRPKTKFSTANLASELIKKGYSFGGYSESLPKTGFDGSFDSKFKYARKHNPWTNFTNVPSSANMPFSAFPKDFSKLPDVSFVVPNLDHDIHDGTVKQADDWLKQNLSAYVEWARKNNSLFIVTWDEDDFSSKNKIPTFLVGPMIKPGSYALKSNHFSLLRTIENLYGLPPLGASKSAEPLQVFR